MEHRAQLRPIERRILALVEEGVPRGEIARRFRRSPEFVDRVTELARLDRAGSVGTQIAETLRPIERRVLQWRANGAAYDDIAGRFRKSPEFIERVETFAQYKLGLR